MSVDLETSIMTASEPNSAQEIEQLSECVTVSDVESSPALDIDGATECVNAFLKALLQAAHSISSEVNPTAVDEYQSKIYDFLQREIRGFDAALSHVTDMQLVSATAQTRSALRHFIKRSAPIALKARLQRSRVISEIYSLFLAPQNSKLLLTLRRGSTDASSASDARKIDPNAAHAVFFRLNPEQLAEMAKYLVSKNEKSVEASLRDVAEYENVAAAKKALFVTHLFPTTWAPTVRSLRDHGVHTAWLGNQDVRSFENYGVLETPRVPTNAVYVESFIGTLAFMRGVHSARILLSGECFYSANWNGLDAWILYTIINATIEAVQPETEKFAEGRVTLLMYDGLKPVARAGPVRAEISRAYSRMMRAADKIVYNSNTEMFGDYVDYAYDVSLPRLHFYRYSEEPSEPLPRLDLENGNNIHMACITVCLAEFGEPSRDSVPQFVRSIIVQGIHFHYYCDPSDPVVRAFEKSLPVDKRKFFHPHPINKDQQELVNELHQYHVAFNPSDHIPFAQGIASLADREYQDGMSVFWQSTVGTSFLVYSAAGVPFVLPRGCVGSTDLLAESALPATLGEFKNMRRFLSENDLEQKMIDADRARVHSTIDAHIERLIDFLF